MINYAPLISDKIPAFLNQSTITIKIPFEMNPGVYFETVKRMYLQIKDYNSSKIIKTNIDASYFTDKEALFGFKSFSYQLSDNENAPIYTFPTTGSVYKLQIAYDDGNDNELKWSTASLGKCIADIDVYIGDINYNNLTTGNTIENYINYSGVYNTTLNGDPLYSYQFNLYDYFNNDKPIKSSEEQIYNSKNNIIQNNTVNSISFFKVSNDDLDPNRTYILDFTITTVNGYTTTISQELKKAVELEPIYDLQLSAAANSDEGYIELKINSFTEEIEIQDLSGQELQIYTNEGTMVFNEKYPLENQKTKYSLDLSNYSNIDLYYNAASHKISIVPGNYCLSLETLKIEDLSPAIYTVKISLQQQILINGKFILDRYNINKNLYEEIIDFEIGLDKDLSSWFFKDFTIESGMSYKYRLRQYNNNKISIPIETNTVKVDFEDVFLSDKDRQLKIKFNPKISSFKTTILESKMETIGSQYPFFFRNNQIGYKEIPISGLISYLMDENNLFTSIDKKPAAADYGTSLTGLNVAAEKDFKLEVFNWLNNGQPKLFRSPTEGNYLIRLMSVSLSPEDQLGRMLHNFSATGYEIGDSSLESLNKNNIIDLDIIKASINYVYIETSISSQRHNVKNIVWKNNNFPSSGELIFLDKNSEEQFRIKNNTGIVETPKEKIFENIVLSGMNNNDIISFEQLDTSYNSSLDTFGQE